jgi:hypothetical protein
MVDQAHQPKDEAAGQQGEQTLFVGAERALIGGLLAAGVAAGGQWFVGQVYSGVEARNLLEAMLPSARSVGSAVVTASGTILALMLTMLSLTSQAKSGFDRVFYKRIERIGLLSTIALAMGTLLLLLLSIPLQESQQVPSSWYRYVYYLLIALTAGLSGLLVAIVLMLYNAITSLIMVLGPGSQDAASSSGLRGSPDAAEQTDSSGPLT